MRILVADDDPISLTIMAAVLKAMGHEVSLAHDGEEAYALIRQQEIAFVISDWNMPKMEGPELCRRLRAAALRHYVYFILLTVRGDKASLIEGMEAGADDFLVKPVDREELRVRVRAGQRILDLQQQLEERNDKLLELNQELQQASDTIRRDLEAAANLQRELLPPPASLQGVTFDWLFRPSHVLAGDMFGYFPLTDHVLAFYQLDVAGHGIPSALLSFTLSHVLAQGREGAGLLLTGHAGSTHQDIVSPQKVVAELNRRFSTDRDSYLYFTMLYGVMDTRSGQVTLTQAGHPGPLWLHQRGGQIDPVGGGGFPIGMLPNLDYEEMRLELAAGDRLFIYSDGVTDCEGAAGEQFTQARLMRILEQTHDRPLPAVTQAVGVALSQWKGDERYQDDISLLALEYDRIRPPS
jgi:sigma-B regulation protein RsbU (phosphoserine phosphatase)